MGFEYDKFKVQLKLAMSRLQSLQLRHQNSLCGRRKEVADFLKSGQEERARQQVKYLVRDDYMSEVYDMLGMMLDDLLRSAMLLSQYKKSGGVPLDSDLHQVCASIIYAAGRVDIPELLRLKDQLISKLGSDCQASVDQKLVVKLGIRNADGQLVNRYLLAIAESYGVAWAPAVEEGDLLHLGRASPASDRGFSPVQSGMGLSPLGMPPPYSPPTAAASSQPSPRPSSPPPPTTTDSPSNVSDFDDLARRFEALKGKK